MEFEDFVRLCDESNESSKDLDKWIINGNLTSKGKQELERIWDWCLKKHKVEFIPKKNHDEYISKDFLENKKYIKFIKNYSKYASHKNKKLYTSEFLTEIFKRIEHSDNNPRKINSKVRLTKKKKESLCIGYQFPRNYQEKLKSHLGITKGTISYFNSFFYTSGILKQYIEEGTKGYINKYNDSSISSCRQFVLNDSIINFYLYFNAFRSIFSFILPILLNILLCVISFQ